MKLPLTVVILAGGASRRMGRDKALLKIGGRRVIDLAVAHYSARAREVLVASGKRTIPRLSAPQCEDAAGCGPLAGLAAGLAVASTPWVLLTACDQPPPPDALLALLWRYRRASKAVCVVSNGDALPMPALYHRGLLPSLRGALTLRRGPSSLLHGAGIRRIRERLWREADPEGRVTGGWNTPGAFQRHDRTAFDPSPRRP